MDKPKNIAPEPYFSAAIEFLYHVALFMRNCADTICQEQLSDLGDAIHNVPHSLIYYGENLNEATIRDLFLAAYDQKWANSDGDFSLLRALDAAENRREN